MIKLDPWLSPFQDAFKRRFAKAQEWINKINDTEGSLDKFSKARPTAYSSSTSPGLTASQGTNSFGFNVDAQGQIIYREWAPNATQAFLTGDFSRFPPCPMARPPFWLNTPQTVGTVTLTP